jgi:L-ascorbate metabolism protein UlaG (beta-lactamase superfamily)
VPPKGQQFYAVEMLVVLPIFIGFCAVVAHAELPHSPGRPVGIAATLLGVVLVAFGLRGYYVATIGPDGTLTFTALTRATSTATAEVSRIDIRTGGRGTSWVFHFNGTRAVLAGLGGRALSRSIVALYPGVPHPARP